MARTKDQTEVQKLLEDGAITKYQAQRYPRRNVLLSAMSSEPEFDLFQDEFVIEFGDRILLTTDGFHNKLLRGHISRISVDNPAFEDFWLAVQESLSSTTIEDDASCLAIEID